MPNKTYVYSFAETGTKDKMLLGGKGANLAVMTSIGLPVPPGLTITTEACNEYLANGGQFPAGLEDQLREKLHEVEKATGKTFGDENNPLLVSVRSGAPISMPGMMDTILNLGLNDRTVEGLARATGDERFAYDCYRRFIQMFSDVVLGVEHFEFENLLADLKFQRRVQYDHELSAADLRQLVDGFKQLVARKGQAFPQDPFEQLLMAIRAVFGSWNNQRAIVYRKLNNIPDHLGTAVNVQTMVFGNMGDDSGTGVAFTRNPSTGEKQIYGEYLINAQGEDVVAGIRTPQPIASLAQDMPEIYEQFTHICQLLEKHYRDMQDIEFTVEKGKLYILQTRAGKRTTAAAIRIAVEMVQEGMLTKEEALMRIEPSDLDQLLHRRIDPQAQVDVLAKGLPASPGAASGRIVFSADEAEALAQEGHKVLLVRTETTPDDIHGMVAAQGILTSRGGMTSHAAVVARGMGKPCVCGCEALKIDYTAQQFTVNGRVFKKGDVVSIDGSTGRVIAGEIKMIEPELSEEFNTLLAWADEIPGLGVRANADNPADAKKALDFGAKGIGLVRTEHMFMATDRLPLAQRMILAATDEERAAALAELQTMQEGDFYDILKVMAGYPVCIRLLDPPLHEFLPSAEQLLLDIAKLKYEGGDQEELARKEALLVQVRNLSELNPMLGHRGCRLGVTFPEIYRMQARAIFSAMARLEQEGYSAFAEVEIPLVGSIKELTILKEEVNRVAEEVQAETGVTLNYHVGTMIELPRACLIADQIASASGFFTFGTNDLTQTTFGFSRDDAEGKFLPHYLEAGILTANPFAVIDREGVGELMRIAVERGRQANPEISIGICGEHGGNPESIEFCYEIGLNYVSCSPYRVPIARLAAAQAAIRKQA
ncbi:MAG: pyruvate, phosphate dikinase [Firmicutes bacterium]|nr:pyruvate, phosphate dikinase [Bacillota bacterium]